MSEAEKLRLKQTGVEMNSSVKKVIAFMEREVLADDLQGVAEAVATLAPAIWGHHGKNKIRSISLIHPL